jgi:DNA uptake protein ComE-like DNA-binding protein
MSRTPVELNLVGAAELSLLPGVSDELARELVRRRENMGPFRSWDEVRAVKGMSPAALEVLMDRTVLEPEDFAA